MLRWAGRSAENVGYLEADARVGVSRRRSGALMKPAVAYSPKAAFWKIPAQPQGVQARTFPRMRGGRLLRRYGELMADGVSQIAGSV